MALAEFMKQTGTPSNASFKPTVTSYVPKNATAAYNAVNSSAADATNDAADVITEKISMLDNLLNDLNVARRSYEQNKQNSASTAAYSTMPSRHSNQTRDFTTATNSLNRRELNYPDNELHQRATGTPPLRLLAF